MDLGRFHPNYQSCALIFQRIFLPHPNFLPRCDFLGFSHLSSLRTPLQGSTAPLGGTGWYLAPALETQNPKPDTT